MPRFFTENIDQNSGSITGEDAKHIARVLRMKNGQPLTVCDTKGYDYACTIEGITDEQIDLKVLSRSPSVTEPNVSVHLYQAMPKADKLELIIQKAVELGVNSITPVMTRRCVSRPDAKSMKKKLERYNRIAVEAAKQCGRGVLPDVALPLANFGAVCRTFAQYDLVLFCYECGGAPLRQLLADAKPADGQRLKIALITGAEGGFAVEEAEMAANAGVKTVGLGPRILRCETAPLAVLSAVMTLTGNLE